MHIATVGTSQILIENLWERIARAGGIRFTHLMEPSLHPGDWRGGGVPANARFFSPAPVSRMPDPDDQFLASFEREGVPTLHNMILGDRIVSKLDYHSVRSYCTFLARRLISFYEEMQPEAVIGGFDSLHGGLGLAVARKLNIPWFALNFSVIPSGLASFCTTMSPAARVPLDTGHLWNVSTTAESALEEFRARRLRVPAYIAPVRRGFLDRARNLPRRTKNALRIAGKWPRRSYLRFVVEPGDYDPFAAIRRQRRAAAARKALAAVPLRVEPPPGPYVFFGLHTQPESSIDVLAPFFSNQFWVIELLARSLPPTHRLLVKIHKSDVSNYGRAELDHMRALPGVELVAPSADARRLIESAALVFSIQGTIGLEAALIGKPVISLGDSPIALFPSVVPIGRLTELPATVRRALALPIPSRERILAAYCDYLRPFAPAAYNDWTQRPTDGNIAGLVGLFECLATWLRSEERDTSPKSAVRT